MTSAGETIHASSTARLAKPFEEPIVSHGNRWRAVVVAAVIIGAVWVSLTQPIQLGLDLRGGIQIVLEAEDTETVTVDGLLTAKLWPDLGDLLDGDES